MITGRSLNRILHDNDNESPGLSPFVVFIVPALPLVVSIADRLIPSLRPYIKHVRVKRIVIPSIYLDFTLGLAIVAIIHVVLMITVGATAFESEYVNGKSNGESAVTATGMVAIMNYWLVLLPSSKTRIVFVEGSEASGVPFERAIKYHQIIGVLAIITTVIHLSVASSVYSSNILFSDNAVGDVIPIFGYVALIITCAMAWTSIESFRRLKYEIFQRFHHMYILVVIFICLHTDFAILGFLPGIIYHGIDTFYKLYSYFSSKKLALAICSKSSTEILTIRVPIDKSNPQIPELGGYYYINFPEVSKFEWHPFSVSSYDAPSSTVTFHIKALESGSFTKQFYDYFDRLTDGSSDGTVSLYGQRISLNGPFGSLSINLELYNHIILIAGGIGVTPMWMILDDIINYINDRGLYQVHVNEKSNTGLGTIIEFRKKRKIFSYPNLRKVTLIWTYRDEDLPDIFAKNIPTEETFAAPRVSHSGVINITATDIPKQNIMLDYLLYETGSVANNTNKQKNQRQEKRFDIRVGNTQIYGHTKYIQHRPNLRKMFKKFNMEKWLGDQCVVGCGPYGLIHDVKELSGFYGFDTHIESFEL